MSLETNIAPTKSKIQINAPGCHRCLGMMQTDTHCCHCDGELGKSIDELGEVERSLRKRLRDAEGRVQHWKSNHQNAVSAKRRISEKYGDLLLENRLLVDRLTDNERTKWEGRQAPTLFGKARKVWEELRSSF